ncbi:peptide chain release factor 1-like, mitochondrial [Orussus abietinus]|uniref:peptide chain release factor 1-like, mitochondrial n=1 Tax=Orussus abietinus TaxID=222816 RepID=UPI0006254FCB|nr:peptide chain release factor 1-like, mitochondrial [Orussus abietinus]
MRKVVNLKWKMLFLTCVHKCSISLVRLQGRYFLGPASLLDYGLANAKRAVCTSTIKFSTFPELSLDNPDVRKYLDRVVSEYREEDKFGHKLDRCITDLVRKRIAVTENIESVEELAKQDEEMKKLAVEEVTNYKEELVHLNEKLLDSIVSSLSGDNWDHVIMEITAGVGGKEAMLFSKELLDMYLSYLNNLGFTYEFAKTDTGDVYNAIRHASILISGRGAFQKLRYEGGVHRVQRVPATESTGRIHTSTATVVILPQPSEIDIVLKDKDLKIEVKHASGAGGQSVNTTHSAVRIVHLPTGTMVECQETRSQLKNKDIALLKLRTILYQRQLEEQIASTSELRKKQRGLGNRNERIRTYNYNQNRVTDHRLTNGTIHNLKGFLEGGELFEELQEQLQHEWQKEIFFEILKEMKAGR